jgi:hypothetical protein
MRRIARLALLSVPLLLATAPAVGRSAGETRRYLRDWLAVCGRDDGAACSASAYDPGEGGASAPDYQLRLTRPDPDGDYVLSLLTRKPLDETQPMRIRVDLESTLELASGEGFQLRAPDQEAEDPASEFAVTDARALATLLQEMRQGARIRFWYMDREGGEHRATFSLMGFSDALAFVDAQGTVPEPIAAPAPVAAAASPSGSAPSRDRAWATRLGDLLPAIASCLARVPAPPAVITKAWPMDRGLVGVRLRCADGSRWDCTAPSGGGEVTRLAPVGEGQRLPGEDTILFSPPDGEPPSGHCYWHERVFDAERRFLGWLSHDTC